MSEISAPPEKLFGDIDARFERDDEWSYPKSVSIGWPLLDAPTSDDFRDFSTRYFAAMRSICAVVEDNKVEDYVASYPIIFLFRHSVELALKAVILHQSGERAAGHDLSRLIEKVSGLPKWVETWIDEIHRLDTRSTGLRYPDTEVGFFEAGALMHEWSERTETLHSALIAHSYKPISKEEIL